MSEKNNIINIGFCSRLEEEKGVDVLLGLVEYLRNYPALGSTIALHICGDGTKSSLIGNVTTDRTKYDMSHISSDGIAGIYYYGRRTQKDLALLYRHLDITLMPSRFLETFGLGALESLASGVPVMGFRKGGLVPFIPEKLSLDKKNPVGGCIKIIENMQAGEMPRALDVSSYSHTEWEKRLSSLLGENQRILVVHDYRDRIGGAEGYVIDVIATTKELGKAVELFSYEGITTPWKRRWMFIFSLFAFWRGVSLWKKLNQEKPEIIWMQSVLRYVGPWGIYAIRKYKNQYPETRIFLAHHDVGFLSAFPQLVYEEDDIPRDASLRSFLSKVHSPILKLIALGKWCYIHINRYCLPENTEHLVFSPFLNQYIKSHFRSASVIEFPHSVDMSIFHPEDSKN